MFKKLFAVAIFFFVFYMMSENYFTVSERQALGFFLVMFLCLLFFIGPSIIKDDEKNDDRRINVIDKEWKEGDYHNDFSRVGSSTDERPVKPVDYSGDALAHARETLNEDLKKISKKEE